MLKRANNAYLVTGLILNVILLVQFFARIIEGR
jgi:hypothetical protein